MEEEIANDFEGSLNKFVKKVDSVRQRAAALLQRVGESASGVKGMTPETLEELQTSLEELCVAEEELRAQNEELMIARAQVEAERQRYHDLFEFAPDGYLVTNVVGIISEANRAAAELLKVSQQFLVGKPLINYIPQPERQNFRSKLDRLHQINHLHEWEVRVCPRESAAFDAALSVSTVRDNNKGRPIALRWLVRDITERKQAAVLVEQARLAALSADISAALAKSGPIRLVLQQCAEALVCHFDIAFARFWTLNEAADVLELQASAGLYTALDGPYSCIPLGQLKLGQIAQTRQQYLTNTVFDDPQISDREWAKHEGLVTFGGYPLLVEERLVGVMAMFGRQPLVAGTLNELVSIADGIAQCIERKRAEAERDQLLIREQAARAEAEAATRMKDEFLAIVSHELRSPLNAILGWAQLLRSKKFDQAIANRALETIERNAHLQTKLINDLLDTSRIIQGKLQLQLHPVNLVQVISAAITTVQLTADAKAIQLKPVLDANVGLVLGDADRLQQVISNLLSNAIKFTPEGGRIEVRLEQSLDLVQITVTDTGAGINPEFIPYIFDRFRQADNTSTRSHGGLGLGLAIVRHLVELHGGSILAESAGEGQGATFTIQFPLHQGSS